MLMDLYSIVLKVSDCCDYVDCSKHSFTGWCRNGYIKAHRAPTKTSPWRIRAIDFADFLYFNKYYQGMYRCRDLIDEADELRNSILEEIDSRPPVMNASELSELFNVRSQTIRNWVKNGALVPCGKTSNRLCVVQVNEIRKAFNRQPWMRIRYRTIYMALNGRKANRKLLAATSL